MSEENLLHRFSVWISFSFFPFFFYTNGESLLIIPQCLCRLICMWLISVWRAVCGLWQEPGLQRLAQPPGCFGDRIPVTCHPRKICTWHSCPLSISNMSVPITITFKRVCVYPPVCASVWAPSYKGVDIRYCLFFCSFPYVFSLCCCSMRWAQILL